MNKIKFTKDFYIDAPSIKEGYPIEKKEWDKIKKMVENIRMTDNRYQTWMGVLVGIAVTSFLTLIGFYNTEKTSDIIININWIVIILAVLLTLTLKMLTKDKDDDLSRSKQDVIDEMAYIVEDFKS